MTHNDAFPRLYSPGRQSTGGLERSGHSVPAGHEIH